MTCLQNKTVMMPLLLLLLSLLFRCESFQFHGQAIRSHRKLHSAASPSKGFGKPKPIPEAEQEVPIDTGSQTYDIQSKRGVPEYNIFLRPYNGTDNEWVPVGSMTIPRDVTVSKAILEVEPQLLRGTFKIFPKLKAYAEFRKDKENIFQYGYCLKAFPDEPIKLVTQEEKGSNGNFFVNW